MKNNERRLHISILKTSLVLLAVIGAIFFVAYASKHYAKLMNINEKTPDVKMTEGVPNKGTFSLESASGRTVFLPLEDISVVLYASSYGVSVSGYDLMLTSQLPGAVFTVKDAESLLPGLDVQVVDGKMGWINGSLNLQSLPEGVVLDTTQLASFTIEHEGQKMIDIGIDFTAGETRDSNMMQMTPPSDILSEVHGLTLYIGTKVKLTPSASYTLPGSDVSIRLIKVIVPEGLCNDCSTQAEVEIKKGSESKKASFMLGGIQGKETDTVDLYGYRFETTEINNDALEVYLAPIQEAYEQK